MGLSLKWEWHYRKCPVCANNAHEEVTMVKSFLIDPRTKKKIEVWACPKCGFVRKV